MFGRGHALGAISQRLNRGTRVYRGWWITSRFVMPASWSNSQETTSCGRTVRRVLGASLSSTAPAGARLHRRQKMGGKNEGNFLGKVFARSHGNPRGPFLFFTSFSKSKEEEEVQCFKGCKQISVCSVFYHPTRPTETT